MARLANSTDTLVRLQSKLYRLEKEKNDLRSKLDRANNRVMAAEAAAHSAVAAYQKLLKENEELTQLLKENND